MFHQEDGDVRCVDTDSFMGESECNNGYFHKIKVSPPLMATTTMDSCTTQGRILPSFHGLPSLSLINSARCCPVFFLREHGGEGGVDGEGGAGSETLCSETLCGRGG